MTTTVINSHCSKKVPHGTGISLKMPKILHLVFFVFRNIDADVELADEIGLSQFPQFGEDVGEDFIEIFQKIHTIWDLIWSMIVLLFQDGL